MFTRTCLNSGRKCSETDPNLIFVSNVYDLDVIWMAFPVLEFFVHAVPHQFGGEFDYYVYLFP